MALCTFWQWPLGQLLLGTWETYFDIEPFLPLSPSWLYAARDADNDNLTILQITP